MQSRCGTQIKLLQYIYYYLGTNDIVLFTKSSRELQIILDALRAANLGIGRTMNRSKTKMTTNRTKDPKSVVAAGDYSVKGGVTFWSG